jgi:hypothetical protein
VRDETSARASFDWARAIGGRWRGARGAARLDPSATDLLRVAFGDGPVDPTAGPLDHARRHDESIGAAVVLSGLSPEGTARRAVRGSRTQGFAEAAAWAYAVAERDPRAFAVACRVFRTIRLSWEEGVASALLGFSDPGADPIYQLARRAVRAAVARRATWVTVARLRAHVACDDGFADGALDRVDETRLVRDAAYRVGAYRGRAVLRTAGRAAVARELAARAFGTGSKSVGAQTITARAA